MGHNGVRFVVVLFCSVLGLWLAGGCATNPVDVGLQQAMPGAQQSGRATVSFSVQVTPDVAPASIRVEPTNRKADARVRFILRGLTVTGETEVASRSVDVGADGRASTTIENVPTGPTIAEAQIDNGSVDGYTDFQGAVQLNSGPNAMVINPTGSGMTSDLLAQVLRLVAQSRVLSSVPQADLVGLAQQVIAGTSGARGTQTQVDAFNSLLERVNSPTFVQLRGSVDGRSLEAWRAGNLLWTKPLADWFQAAQLNGASPAGLKFSQVIRHGLAGYGYVTLGHDADNLSVMIRIDIVNQSLKAFCAVPGTVGPAIVLVDDSVVVGGWHATERCPYALRWGGQNSGLAHFGSSSDTGLMWARYFASDAPPAGGEPAAVESLAYDGQRIFTAQVRNGSSRLLRTYRLNSGDGTGTTTQTTIRLAAWAQAGAGFVDLGWNAIGGVTTYRVRWAAGAAPDPASTYTEVATNTWRHSGLANGTTYYYLVTALLNGQEVVRSPTVSATPVAARPPAPTNLAANSGSGSIRLTWQPVSGAIRYRLYWSEQSGISPATGNSINDVTSPYVHAARTNGTRYYYTICALNGNGESAGSNVVSAVPRPSPTGLTAIGVDQAIRLNWTAVPGASSYEVYSDTSPAMTRAGSSRAGTTTSTSFTHSGATNNVRRYYLVSAVFPEGQQTDSLPVGATPRGPVTGVTAVQADGRVTVTWPPVTDAVGYSIFAGRVGSPSTRVDNQASPYVHSGLTNGADYQYSVFAQFSDGETPQGATVTARPFGPPTNVRATIADSQITLTWDPAPGATGYHLYKSESSNVSAENDRIANVTSPKTVTGLTNGLRYYFVLTSLSGTLQSAPSAVVSAVPRAVSAPGGLIASAVPGLSINLAWQPVTGATGYAIYRTGGGATTRLAAPGVLYIDTSAIPGISYTYVVNATFAEGESAPSAVVAVAWAPLAPSGVSATASGNSQTTVFWSPVTGATSYNLYWSTVTGVTPLNGTRVTGAVSPHVHSGVVVGNTYYYVIAARNSAGESPPSTEVSMLVRAVPSNMVATRTGNLQSTISWSPVPGATSYNVYWTTVVGVDPRTGTQVSVATNSFVHDVLTHGAEFRYAVTAVDGSGESGPSEVVSLWLSPRSVVDLGNGVTMSFVTIPGGTFMMGSPDSEAGRWPEEGPQHQVTLSDAFQVQATEVTQAQWLRVMGSGPVEPLASYEVSDTFPATNINWYEAVRFCNALSMRQGLVACYANADGSTSIFDGDTVSCNWSASGFRLPTEAEWEYACRAGTTTARYWGAYWDPNYSWNYYESQSLHPVGMKSPNAWGLYDMIGNNFEWCWDRFGSYSSAAAIDPRGAETGSDRVVRSGIGSMVDNSHSALDTLRSAWRGPWFGPTQRGIVHRGFRVVCRTSGAQ